MSSWSQLQEKRQAIETEVNNQFDKLATELQEKCPHTKRSDWIMNGWYAHILCVDCHKKLETKNLKSNYVYNKDGRWYYFDEVREPYGLFELCRLVPGNEPV